MNKRMQILIILICCFALFIPSPVYVYAFGEDSAKGFTWGGMIQVGKDERTYAISTIINLSDLSTKRLLGGWSQNQGELPTPTDKTMAECKIFGIGFEKIVEVGLSPDMGLTRYPAVPTPGKGYIVNLDMSKFGLGMSGLNWYVIHMDNRGRLVIVILVFSWAEKGIAQGGCFLHVVRAPEDWNEMPDNLKLSYCHGFLPIDGWSSQPQEVERWRQERLQFGDILIKGKPGNIVEFECSNGQVGQEQIQPNTEGFCLSKLPVGAVINAKYRGQRRWSGSATVIGARRTILEVHGFGGLKILSAQRSRVELEINSSEGQITNKRFDVNGAIEFPEVFEGLIIRAKKDNFWSEPVTIVANDTKTINLDQICNTPLEPQPIQPIDIDKTKTQ